MGMQKESGKIESAGPFSFYVVKLKIVFLFKRINEEE